MSWQTQIIAQLTTIQNWINSTNSNKKQINELDETTIASTTDEIVIDQGLGAKRISVSNFLGTAKGPVWSDTEQCYISKEPGNINLDLIEALDIVYEKDVTHSGIIVTLRGWRYDSGDRSLRTSYTKIKSYI